MSEQQMPVQPAAVAILATTRAAWSARAEPAAIEADDGDDNADWEDAP